MEVYISSFCPTARRQHNKQNTNWHLLQVILQFICTVAKNTTWFPEPLHLHPNHFPAVSTLLPTPFIHSFVHLLLALVTCRKGELTTVMHLSRGSFLLHPGSWETNTNVTGGSSGLPLHSDGPPFPTPEDLKESTCS